MSNMPREPEAFAEHVLQLIQQELPAEEVELAGPMDVLVSGRHLDLNNLFRMVRCEPSRGDEIVREFLSRITEGEAMMGSAMPLSLVQSRIMPRIQPNSLFEQLDKEQVAHTPWVNDTSIVYVIDMPRVTVSITLEQIIKWGLDIEQIEAKIAQRRPASGSTRSKGPARTAFKQGPNHPSLEQTSGAFCVLNCDRSQSERIQNPRVVQTGQGPRLAHLRLQ